MRVKDKVHYRARATAHHLCWREVLLDPWNRVTGVLGVETEWVLYPVIDQVQGQLEVCPE